MSAAGPRSRLGPWPAVGLGLWALGWLLESPPLFALGALVLATGALATLWARASTLRVGVERRLRPRRVFAGEQTTLTLRLRNDKPLPLGWIRLVDEVPTGLEWGERVLMPSSRSGRRELLRLAALGPYEELDWSLELPCPKRGHYRFGPARLRSGDPFGLYEREALVPRRDRLVVYPALRPLARLGFPERDPLGLHAQRRALLSDPLRPAGVRDYVPGDPRRQVSWKASSRGQGLKVHELEPVSERSVVVLLNTATESATTAWVRGGLQEAAIAVAGSICVHADRDGHPVGLAATGSVPGGGTMIRVPPRRGRGHLPALLEALAAVSPFVRGRIEQLVLEEGRRAPWGAVLVVVSTHVDPALLRALLRAHAAGRPLLLASLEADTDLPALPFPHQRVDLSSLEPDRHARFRPTPDAGSEAQEGRAAAETASRTASERTS